MKNVIDFSSKKNRFIVGGFGHNETGHKCGGKRVAETNTVGVWMNGTSRLSTPQKGFFSGNLNRSI